MQNSAHFCLGQENGALAVVSCDEAVTVSVALYTALDVTQRFRRWGRERLGA
jgi:hypothetical protein